MTTLHDAASRPATSKAWSCCRRCGPDTIQSSLVNAGILGHPATGETILAVVAAGPVKLANRRGARPQVTATFRNGWQWAAVEGRAELVGPDDPQPWLDAEGLRLLLRAIFTAAGGEHDDWDGYDQAMARQRRAAVLIRPDRVLYSNGISTCTTRRFAIMVRFSPLVVWLHCEVSSPSPNASSSIRSQVLVARSWR